MAMILIAVRSIHLDGTKFIFKCRPWGVQFQEDDCRIQIGEECFIHYTIFMQSEKNNFFCPGILENLIIRAQKNVALYTYSIAQRYMAKKTCKGFARALAI